MKSILSKAVLRFICERAHHAAIEFVTDTAVSVVMGNEYVESFDGRGTAFLGCGTWLLAFQYQPAIHTFGAHIRSMPGLRQAVFILAPHNVVNHEQSCWACSSRPQIVPRLKRLGLLKSWLPGKS